MWMVCSRRDEDGNWPIRAVGGVGGGGALSGPEEGVIFPNWRKKKTDRLGEKRGMLHQEEVLFLERSSILGLIMEAGRFLEMFARSQNPTWHNNPDRPYCHRIA
jgi:hypothetical protein